MSIFNKKNIVTNMNGIITDDNTIINEVYFFWDNSLDNVINNSKRRMLTHYEMYLEEIVDTEQYDLIMNGTFLKNFKTKKVFDADCNETDSYLEQLTSHVVGCNLKYIYTQNTDFIKKVLDLTKGKSLVKIPYIMSKKVHTIDNGYTSVEMCSVNFSNGFIYKYAKIMFEKEIPDFLIEHVKHTIFPYQFEYYFRKNPELFQILVQRNIVPFISTQKDSSSTNDRLFLERAYIFKYKLKNAKTEEERKKIDSKRSYYLHSEIFIP
jgi:hypothetical protein